MADSRALTPVDEADYEAIEAAVMETARGRWFLAEYARRNRTADTGMLLDAIQRLESAVVRDREGQDIERLRDDLAEMARTIAQTKSEIAAMRPPHQPGSDLSVASGALDGIVRATEQATQDILEAAEHVQEAAWTLREGGAEAGLCDELDRRATEIYTACSFQDLTAQRTAKIIQTLRYLERRVEAMIALLSVDGTSADASPGADLSRDLGVFDGLSQVDIDSVIVEETVDGLWADAADSPAADVLWTGTAEAPAVEASWADAADGQAMEGLWAESTGGATGLPSDVEPGEQAGDAPRSEAALDLPAEDERFTMEELDLLDEAPACPAQEVEEPAAALPVEPDPAPASLNPEAFAAIDALSSRDKLRLFT